MVLGAGGELVAVLFASFASFHGGFQLFTLAVTGRYHLLGRVVCTGVEDGRAYPKKICCGQKIQLVACTLFVGGGRDYGLINFLVNLFMLSVGVRTLHGCNENLKDVGGEFGFDFHGALIFS